MRVAVLVLPVLALLLLCRALQDSLASGDNIQAGPDGEPTGISYAEEVEDELDTFNKEPLDSQAPLLEVDVPVEPKSAQNWAQQTSSNITRPHLPSQRSWIDFSMPGPGIFPALRHHVRRWTLPTTSWVSPNSLSSTIPEPPSCAQGPLACACGAPAGADSNGSPDVYGQMERTRRWTWCADFWDSEGDKHPEATYFIPDIWGGCGPCRALDRWGILHHFPSEAAFHKGDSHFLRPSTRNLVEVQTMADDELIALIWPSDEERHEAQLPTLDRRIYDGAPSAATLLEWWAEWVQTLLEGQGYILHHLLSTQAYQWLAAWRPGNWDRLLREEHFGPAPISALFHNTLVHANRICCYIAMGVPVYYRWEIEYCNEARLADLAPHAPSEDTTAGIPNPPMSPHCSANKRAWELWTHSMSKRPRPPAADSELDDSPEDWFISPELRPNEQYQRWRESAAMILQRRHAHAVLFQGGILWRMAPHLNLDVNIAIRGPSDNVQENGSLFSIGPPNGPEFWDDYLSADKIAILIRQVGCSGSATLFPRPDMFTQHWWADGIWKAEHKAWFAGRIAEVETVRQLVARSREDWCSALKKNQRYSRI
ncbi:hypothetical protein AURDEDRAFT_128005 [Auricularia subglabra TFB-10046 SS5]|nr:hypothetical protein AURDEDRAFT_128005 [Auricularia subglabra TFB-10046 SS5]